MLRITRPIQPQNNPEPQPENTKSQRSMEELLRIKKRIEEETAARRNDSHRAIAEMFLAGPDAWPDCSEEFDYEDEWEEWVPLDQDSQLRADSSDGE